MLPRVVQFAAGSALFAVMALVASTASAQDAATLELGEQMWSDAGCAACHGDNGEGGTSKDQPNGPAFRNTALTHEQLLEVVTCGRPGTPMASWVAGAYTEVACGGASDPAPSDVMMIGMLSPEQADALITYIEATYK